MAHLSDILLSAEVGTTLFIEILLYLLFFIAFIYTLVILKSWDKQSSSEYQYKLEKQSYLVVTIISLALVIKIILLPFFVYTLNELSTIIPGAMCASGVIEANDYGEVSLILKSVIIILILLWRSLNSEDQRAKNHPYFKKKMYFFIAIFVLLTLELILEILYFSNISTLEPVLCCSSIYKEITNPLPFTLSITKLLVSFYTLFISLLVSLYFKKRYLILALSVFYTYISYYAIVYFFSTYIYQLPTHKCPFCLLQADYYYVGYFIYSSLFIATFYAINGAVFKFCKRSYKKAIIYYVVFNIFVAFNFCIYVVKNGVFL